MLRSATTWFLLLLGACIAAPYLLGLRPGTRRDWIPIAVTVGFLAWTLLFIAPLRSL